MGILESFEVYIEGGFYGFVLFVEFLSLVYVGRLGFKVVFIVE